MNEPVGNAYLDIGDARNINIEKRSGYAVVRDDHQLEKLCKITDGKQVSRWKRVSFFWLFEKAIKSELYEIWKDVYIEVNEENVPKNSNFINSHVVFRLRKKETDCVSNLDYVHTETMTTKKGTFVKIFE